MVRRSSRLYFGVRKGVRISDLGRTCDPAAFSFYHSHTASIHLLYFHYPTIPLSNRLSDVEWFYNVGTVIILTMFIQCVGTPGVLLMFQFLR